MFLTTGVPELIPLCFPRIRGDVPKDLFDAGFNTTFSPHTRGCSHKKIARNLPPRVFPTYAGMFRFPDSLHLLFVRFPRIRGDVPVHGLTAPREYTFSPHTRGCSLWCLVVSIVVMVFPAYAGMFRPKAVRKRLCGGFPRIRGDVPAQPVASRC